MCGFTGFVGRGSLGGEESIRDAVSAMSETLRHRGPDDSGEWIDNSVPCALGFRRLAIIDISPAGHQPMVSRSGRYVIAFNGEIYNFEQLRAELPEDTHFQGHSDTEVLLAVIENWGLVKAVRRFVGMFAFAVWDRRERSLHLVRDRVGVKPVYYGWSGSSFLFGSELKALRKHPDFSAAVSRGALSLLMRHNYIPAPYSVYENFWKLEPGKILTIRYEDMSRPVIDTYWSAADVVSSGIRDTFGGSADEAEHELDLLLRESISLRMVADVPLGVFLSGGIDSSTVVSIMQALSSRPVKTFTIGFGEDEYNEARHAKAIAEHLGTDHTELYVTSADALSVVPRLPQVFDEPFADSSQIPTFMVSELARRHVTVSLSGDGGDELFGGYNRYVWGQKIWQRLRLVPKPMRSAVAEIIKGVSPARWDSLFAFLNPVLPGKARQRLPGDKMLKLAGLLDAKTSDEVYRRLVSHWLQPGELIRGGAEPLREHEGVIPEGIGFTHRMMYQDLVSYLPDDILVKVDRASMAVSLESREPLLDHRLIEFAWRLPLQMKLRNGEGKWLLRQVLYRYVPQALVERPKMGFGIPLDSWLRGPLREWAQDLLEEERLEQEGFFYPAPIRQAWEEHLSGRRNWQYRLWNVLMFQAWVQETGNQ